MQMRLNKISTMIGHKNHDFLKTWNANTLMEWAHEMHVVVDGLDSKKMGEVESTHVQIKSLLDFDSKFRLGNVEFIDKDLTTINKLTDQINNISNFIPHMDEFFEQVTNFQDK